MSYPKTPVLDSLELEEETGGLQPIRIDYNCYSLQSEKRILKVKLCVKFSAFLGRIDFVYQFWRRKELSEII